MVGSRTVGYLYWNCDCCCFVLLEHRILIVEAAAEATDTTFSVFAIQVFSQKNAMASCSDGCKQRCWNK